MTVLHFLRMKLLVFASSAFALCQMASFAVAPFFAEEDLFTAGTDGYHTYRIPSLFVTAKGTVLAFCEGRKTGAGDHGDVDLVMQRSTDGGRTWSAQRVVYEEGGEAGITIGNPCPVQDASTGVIWLPFCRDNKAVLITSSADDGETWSAPRDISASVVPPNWAWVATGPGIGIQLTRSAHKGRLVIPSDQRANMPDGTQHWSSHMTFSDDAGKTWQISTPIETGGNECQVIERTDGSLLVNTRMQGDFEGFRGIATSADGGATWSAIAQEKQLPCPKCQGSLVRISDSQLLFSNPNPGAPFDGKPKGRRIDLTVRLSIDDGKTWPVAKLLHEGPSAYSSLGRLSDGTILCLYEGGVKNSSETLKLARFNLEWLTQR